MTRDRGRSFISRAGLKLDHALDEFKVDVAGLVGADFGCNVGGFTDCLLQRGAAKVYAIDTGYGTLAWTLRNDPRVVVMERTNALHALPPLSQGQGRGEGAHESPDTPWHILAPGPSARASGEFGVDLVTIDLAWTPQRLAIPAALKWLKPDGRIITLVKPHYELEEDEKKSLLIDGRLEAKEADRVLHRVMKAMPDWGAAPLAHALSPITGGKSSRGGAGNVEYLVLARAAAK
jgi:23S rRNA (cytidine1920-2'-O)/16S rRNA (cytidine1409-2'-O)-methyltransferase